MNKPADAMQLLEKHFDTAFAAPDGIKKLRELILTLAMQGKLVPQDLNDQPASELLKEIEAEKERLVKEGKIKAQKPLPEINQGEVPYGLPEGWEWVRMGDISEYIQRGKGPSYSDIEEIPVISQKCIQWGGFNRNVVRFIEPSTLDNYQVERFIRSGDLLWNSTGTGTLGRINIYRDELNAFKRVVADSHLTVVRLNGVCNDYILKFLMNPSVQGCIEKNASGTTNQIELNTSTVINQIIPLPPLAEQQRIVAKIDQLMARCDELEKLRAGHGQKRIAANTAALNRLLTATEGKTFSETWAFVMQNFGELYSVKENVAELRKAILQLAVMGKLVPQDPNDQPASELLKEIETEKKRLVKTGKIKQTKPLPEIKPEEVPYGLPERWDWVWFGCIAQHNSGKTLDKCRNIGQYRDYITTSNLYWGHFELDSVRQMPIRDEELDKCTARKGDLLICEGGEAGRAAVWSYDKEICFQNHVHRARFYCDIDPYYAYRFFEKLNATGELAHHRQGVGISNMSSKALASIIFPLPPLSEQRRIVAKIDQLMALCDELEKQIDDATGKQTALLNTVMAQV